MLIKERPIITWLLSPNDNQPPNDIVISNVSNPINYGLLNADLAQLDQIRRERPNWGLPELLMPSFEEVMRKSQRSFEKIMPSLFEEFSNSEECGILLCKNKTIVYGFGGNELHLWSFTEQRDKSVFNFYARYTSVKGHIGVGIVNTILEDDALFSGTMENRQGIAAAVGGFVSSYVAVKKYVKVETVIIPQGKFTEIEGTPLEYVEKKKVINNSGQEVIVMDSRWFRKIVNDNDIYVRGFWRFQNKKNEFGEWYKELIFIDPFVRHGYHRNAKIEDYSDENKSEIEERK
ncbi:MAG: hypothetical protein NC453_26100 [Muribaculum sp.]|nr:hypothetical protein [Muribaculum sp.]